MKAVIKDFAMTRGDTFQFDFKVNNSNSPLYSAYFTIKNKPKDTEAVMQLTIGNGITLVDEDTYRVLLTADLVTDDIDGCYYDLQLSFDDEGSYVITPIKGHIYIEWDVTR